MLNEDQDHFMLQSPPRSRAFRPAPRQVDARAEQVGSETGIKSVHVVPAEVPDNAEPTAGIEGHGCRASVNVEIGRIRCRGIGADVRVAQR